MSVCLFMVSSCDLDLQDSPNDLTPDVADVDFLLNGMQFGLSEYFFELTEYTMETVRMKAMEPRSGTYETAYQPQDFDDMWEQAYVGVLTDGATLIPLAEERSLFVHSGIAKTIQAYTLMTLVDYFGDIPWSEALDPNNFNPTVEDGATVYAAAEALLDAAIEDFGKESLGSPANDLFYNGDATRWTALVNTLKLRLYLTTRLVDGSAADKINKAIADGLIDASGDWDFPFSGDNTTNPSSQHPYFDKNYGGASDYMSNSFMWMLKTEKGIVDPRLRYYFYRQTLEPSSDVNELPCIVENFPDHYPANMVFCHAGDGHWGRDHIDTDGIPPDNQLRTVIGLYPAGGQFDADQGTLASFSDGAQGAGIHPLMDYGWTQFMLAEAALELGTNGDARTYLEEGVRASIAKVMNFAPGVVNPVFEPTSDDVENYVSTVLDIYDNADDKLDVVIKEYFIALFGNGIEAYNAYRRTGKPSNAQPALNPQPGFFINSFAYPSNSVNRNSNITTKGGVDVQVFWDTNPKDHVN